jgi:L-aspartate oxidase
VDTIRTDILVIGTGIAGLSFALRAADYADVVMATKKEQSASNTNFAQGGIASVLAPTDSFDQHVKDTVTAGAGLCRPDVVAEVVHEGPRAVRDLMEWGVAFSPGAEGSLHEYDLGLEGGHSIPRVVHAGDFTGREIESSLLSRAEAHPRITILEHHVATRLLVAEDPVSRQPRCAGADVLSRHENRPRRIVARSVLLATGGAGCVYQHTTNPSIATGDGLAIAYHAGARIANLEFMQFHPTKLYRPGIHPFLISETVRGEGGILRNGDGVPFMKNNHPLADLAPRDVVARAIDEEMKKSGAPHVFLDTTHLDASKLKRRFPNIHSRLRDQGLEMSRDQIPVVPAAHYLCGGVLCDLDGRSSIAGLFVSGEVACTGMHGANRLASNSLLEAVVVSARAAKVMQHELPDHASEWPDLPAVADSPSQVPAVLVSHIRRDVTQIMWDYVGIVRSDRRLDWARRNLDRLRAEADLLIEGGNLDYDLVELNSILTNALLMVVCARRRRESRGLHHSIDCPAAPLHSQGEDTVITKTENYVTA